MIGAHEVLRILRDTCSNGVPDQEPALAIYLSLEHIADS